tara:strand:- start:65 stop:1255 length:1191 start_codon:yes stop_codon:yes gene_type:complete
MYFKLLFVSFLFSCTIFSQETSISLNNIIYDTIYSDKLKSIRDFKIGLPKNYNDNDNKKYPIFFVFDGHYMFDLVSGNINYLSFWDNIPESIVIGINQTDSRYNDSKILDNINYTPISSTANFFDFITLELIPYINKNYRTTNYKVAVGNEITANFINFFLIRKNPIMDAFINISPKYSEKMKQRISKYLLNSEDDIFYYVSTSTQDFKSINQEVLDFNNSMDSLENQNIRYKFRNFKNLFHFNLPAYSIPEAIEHTFSLYNDINKIEYDSIILKLEESPVIYLENKYEKIKKIYGIDKYISISDFTKIEQYIDEKEQFNFFKDLAKLAAVQYNETVLPSYYMGRFYEETGNPRKAMLIYRSAYNMDDFVEITREDLFYRANLIADDFGYEQKEYR